MTVHLRIVGSGGALAAMTSLIPGAASAQEAGQAGVLAANMATEALLFVTRGMELAGIAVIVGGALVTTALFLIRLARRGIGGDGDRLFHRYRSGLGRAILLGLEFLVAADIIGTVAIEPSIDSVLVLGGIVLIRTFLSFSLEVEIEGRLPWRRGSGSVGNR
jgi:uncharacterized membrane protein